MVAEWDITKMEVENEMEIFITLIKYNIFQWREEGKPLLVVNTWSAYYPSLSSSSSRTVSTDIPDPLSPRLPIIHRLRQVFGVTSRIIT